MAKDEEKRKIIEEMGLEARRGLDGELRGFAKEKDSYSKGEVSEFLRVYRDYLTKAKEYYTKKNNESSLLVAISSLVKTIPQDLIRGSNQSFSDILELEEMVKIKLNS